MDKEENKRMYNFEAFVNKILMDDNFRDKAMNAETVVEMRKIIESMGIKITPAIADAIKHIIKNKKAIMAQLDYIKILGAAMNNSEVRIC